MFSVIKRHKEPFNGYSWNRFLADYRDDVEKLPTNSARGTQDSSLSSDNNKCGVGSLCRVAEDGSLWVLNNQNEWVEQPDGDSEDDDESYPWEDAAAKLKEHLSAIFALQKTGKIYQTKIYKFNSNPTSAGVKLLDNEGLEFEPSTDTVEGADDYADIPLFNWWHCNYVRSDDGDPYVTAIKGDSDYSEEGLADVGAMGMTFYWNVDTSNEDYDLWTISDSPNDDYGLVPWVESVRADGTVAPYWCHSAFVSTVDTDDGLPRSLPYKKIADFVSYESIISDYAQKGEGYKGAGISRNLFQMIFNVIMGATKDSTSLYCGVTNWDIEYTAAFERDEEETYFPVTAEQAAELETGMCVSAGYLPSTGKVDKTLANMYAYAHGVKILSIEELGDGEGNCAVYLDVDEGFSTAQVDVSDSVTSDVYMTSWPSYTGESNSVIGKHNGSAVSNTDGRHAYRVQGTEYMCGAYIIASDTAAIYQSDYSMNVYTALKGTAHSSDQSVIESTYKLIGTVSLADYAESGSSKINVYAGDIEVDTESGAWLVSVLGESNSTGWGDKSTFLAAASGIGAYYQGGSVTTGANAGSAAVHCDYGLSSAYWHFCACD